MSDEGGRESFHAQLLSNRGIMIQGLSLGIIRSVLDAGMQSGKLGRLIIPEHALAEFLGSVVCSLSAGVAARRIIRDTNFVTGVMFLFGMFVGPFVGEVVADLLGRAA